MDTGEIREIPEGEQPTPDEVAITQAERDQLMELPPDLRLAMLFGQIRGTDRKAAHAGQAGKAKQRRRAQRKASRRSRG